MDNIELLNKIYERFDKLNDKIDNKESERDEQVLKITNRITAVETKQAGQTKLFYLLITSTIGGIITWITSQFK